MVTEAKKVSGNKLRMREYLLYKLFRGLRCYVTANPNFHILQSNLVQLRHVACTSKATLADWILGANQKVV